MLCTEKLCEIITNLGGNPSSLPDMLEETLVNEIFSLSKNPEISTNVATDAASDTKTVSPKAVKTYADSVVSAANVLTAIQAMDATQVTAVKTALGIS